MKLERLEILSLPGISEGFALEGLAPGVTLVTGPNAIGKSSLVRALKYLLREHERGDPPVSLSADFSDGALRWRVQRTGSVTQWTRNGQAIERPSLPRAEELGRYCMSMEDLIVASAADKSLAGELRRALRGGFDLGKARLSTKPRHGDREETVLREARGSLRDAELTAKSLSECEERLPQLDAEIEQARAAEEQCRRIESAKVLCSIIGERQSLLAALDQFPEGMDKLTGREEEDLETLLKRKGKLRDDKRDAEQRHHQSSSELEQLGFSGKNLDEAEQTWNLVEDKLNEIGKLRDELERSRQDELDQRARLEGASTALGGDNPPQFNSKTLAAAESFAARLIELRTERDELDTRIQIAGTAPDEREIKQHEKAVKALRDWLNSQSNTNSGRPVRRILLASSGAALFAAVGGFAAARGFSAMWGLAVHPIASIGLFLLSALLIVAAWLELRVTPSVKPKVAREDYDETGLAEPAAWRKSEVSERMRSLEESLGGLLVAKRLAEGAEGLRIKLRKTTELLEQIEQQRKSFAEACGFDPEMPITEYERFIRLCRDWDRERVALLETGNLIVAADEKLAANSTVLEKILSPWVDEVQTDFDSLKTSADSFKSRLGQAKKRAEDLRRAKDSIASIERQLADCEQDIKSLYTRTGLAVGEEQQLRERLDRLPSWKDTRREFDDCGSREAQKRKELEHAPDLCALAEAQNTAELDRLLDMRRSTAGQRDSLVEEREQIRNDIKHAESCGTVAEAIAKRTAALVALESKRDESLDSLATDLLLDQVEAAYSADHQPEILREAGGLFRHVTAHEFELELSEDGNFRARDLKQNAIRRLNELSTGTRMQLLLAVRAAWVDRHRSLPLFLDEALTTSDEERTGEVVRSLRALAEAGGVQVVYFSARRNEAALWQEALDAELCVIDLGVARGREPDAEAATFTLEPRPPVPEPSGTPEEYARALAVPLIDPRREAGEIHLFHLLRDDLELLHRLIRDCRVTSLGQIQSMLERQTLNLTGADEAWQARLLARCYAGRVWLDTCRQGRNKEIGRNELESSGVISEIFVDRAVALLESSEIAGNPERFLARLRDGALRGFRQNKADEFEVWLREAQYLDDRPDLPPDDRRERVLSNGEISDFEQAADINRCIDWLEAGLVQARGNSNE